MGIIAINAATNAGSGAAPSPEAKPQFDLVPSSPRRVLAGLLDLAVVSAVVMTVPQTEHGALFALALFIAYHTVLIWLVQQTVGKALMGLKVERAAGRPSFLWALGRASLGYCAVDLFGIGIAAGLFNRSHRCFHDFVFDSRVLASPPETVRLRVLLTRLTEYAERLKKADEARTMAKLTVLLEFLKKLAEGLKKGLDWTLGAAKKAPVKSAIRGLSMKTAVAATLLTASVTAAASFYVPPVRAVADWALTPHVSSHPPEGWGVCGCPDQHPLIGVIYQGQRWHGVGYSCPAK